MKKHKKTCIFCGETFYAKRKDAKTCSNTCRGHLHKQNKTFIAKEKSYNFNKIISEPKINVFAKAETIEQTYEYEEVSTEDPQLVEWRRYCNEQDRIRAKLPYTEEMLNPEKSIPVIPVINIPVQR